MAGAAVVCLLALNLWVSSRALSPASPVSIPYSPTFLSQVQSGNVATISSKGDSIQGTFKVAIRYPATASTKATTFKTQIPSFANQSQLFATLRSKSVDDRRHQSPTPGRPCSPASSSASARPCCSSC